MGNENGEDQEKAGVELELIQASFEEELPAMRVRLKLPLDAPLDVIRTAWKLEDAESQESSPASTELAKFLEC